jgi:hypothetical protein
MTNADVIYELFGNIQLIKLVKALDPEINNLLWYLREPLGEIAYRQTRDDRLPAEKLVFILDDRREDERLTHAFRNYALSSAGMYHVLKPKAKSEADKRRRERKNTSESTGEYLYSIRAVYQCN